MSREQCNEQARCGMGSAEIAEQGDVLFPGCNTTPGSGPRPRARQSAKRRKLEARRRQEAEEAFSQIYPQVDWKRRAAGDDQD